jgi:hypothetical protein
LEDTIFADDCQIYLSFSPNEVARAVKGVNTDLRSVELWAARNGLKLNAQKTHMICMGTSRGVRSEKAYVNSNPIRVFMGTSLEFQESVRSLGMVLDERLTWTAHTNDIVKRVNFRLIFFPYFGIYIYIYLNEDVKKGLVDALVQPIFDYGDVMYFNTGRSNKRRLQRAHNNCVRFIAGI